MIELPDGLSARRTLTPEHRLWLAIACLLVAAGVRLDAYATGTVLIALATAFYLLTMLGKGWLARQAFRMSLVESRPPLLADADLPTYTVLVPLYKEAGVVDGLVRHLAGMEYPAGKLQVLLLCEADDVETLAVLAAARLPAFAEVVVCPPGHPRTKPRACNIGLARATGQLVVIYDAEDRPEPDQLRLAASEFAAGGSDLACVQAHLDYHNAHQNHLTRFFTVEYNGWFDLLLPALSATRLPIPLGGTSNHFRTDVLRRLGAWDAWNVTEDADLGVRLYAAGYRTSTIDSTTWEEACSELRPWIRQRTRWVKGYLQTSLVHLRSLAWVRSRPQPVRAFLAFLVMVPGTAIVNLLNPIFWTMFVVHATTRSPVIVRLIPGPVLYAGVVCLVAGNLMFVYINVLGVHFNRRWSLGRAAIAMPAYWLLMSAASWRALAQLVRRPHLWEKTPHGLGGVNA